MTDSNLKRQEMRRKMTAIRNQLTLAEVTQYSQQIADRVSQLQPLQKAQVIMGFAAFKNEVRLMPLLEKWKAQGRTILLPRVEKAGNMVAVEYTGRENTAAGPFGIREPLGEPFDTSKIEVVLTPGLVFDYKGFRLGYGKGYYDRFLNENKINNFFLLGFGASFQVQEELPQGKWDYPLNAICTEKGVVRCSRTVLGNNNY